MGRFILFKGEIRQQMLGTVNFSDESSVLKNFSKVMTLWASFHIFKKHVFLTKICKWPNENICTEMTMKFHHFSYENVSYASIEVSRIDVAIGNSKNML